MITYEDYTGGALKKVELPFRVLLVGDYSGGTSRDRQDDIEVRRIRNLNDESLDANIRDMGITMNFNVPNVLTDGEEEINVNIPVEGMSTFSPDHLVNQVPVLRTLQSIRETLKEIRARASNDKEVVELLEKLLEDPAAARRLARYQFGGEGGAEEPADE
jgi:type VI secretion system protein ImpB